MDFANGLQLQSYKVEHRRGCADLKVLIRRRLHWQDSLVEGIEVMSAHQNFFFPSDVGTMRCFRHLCADANSASTAAIGASANSRTNAIDPGSSSLRSATAEYGSKFSSSEKSGAARAAAGAGVL
jgi:hypothetical protein